MPAVIRRLILDNVQSIASCLAYSIASNSMVLVNRLLVANKFYGCQERSFVIFSQASIAVLLLQVAKYFRLIKREPFSRKTARKWSPVTIFFVLMLYTSTQATAGLPIHLVVVFKNLTNIGIVLGEWKLFDEPIGALVLSSLFLVLFGAFMAAYADSQQTQPQILLSEQHQDSYNDNSEQTYNSTTAATTTAAATQHGSTTQGYVWMLLNCVCTAGYVLYLRYATTSMSTSIKLSKFGMAFYNNLISMALLLPMMTVSGDAISIWSNPLFKNGGFLAFLFLSGLLGVGLNLASFWCVSVNTATTYATVGALKELPTPFVGVFFLNETLDPATAVYVFCGLAGGILYGYAKYKQRKDEQTNKQIVGRKVLRSKQLHGDVRFEKMEVVKTPAATGETSALQV